MIRIATILLMLGAVMGGCAALPLPVGSGLPASCGDRFSESQCMQGQRCRWINDSKRADGTYATARCTDG
jgi:hypothetical protein